MNVKKGNNSTNHKKGKKKIQSQTHHNQTAKNYKQGIKCDSNQKRIT